MTRAVAGIGGDRRGTRRAASKRRDRCSAGGREPLRDRPAITNVRHIDAASSARAALRRARARSDGATAVRCRRNSCSPILQEARGALEEITGRRTPDDCSRTSSSGSVSVSRLRRMKIVRCDRRSAPATPACEAAYAAARLGARVGLCTLSTRHRRAHAVQSGGRRHREGPSGSRDRRARRPDGPRDRRHRHPVQAAQSQPRAGGLVAARAGGQEGLRRLGAATRSTREPNIEWLIGRAGRILVEHGRVVGLALEDGDAYRVPRAGRSRPARS